MISKEAYEKFLRDVQKQIDDADRKMHQKAEDTLNNTFDNYQNRLLAKIAEELKLAKEALEHGDDRKANEHGIRAEVYKSALDAFRR